VNLKTIMDGEGFQDNQLAASRIKDRRRVFRVKERCFQHICKFASLMTSYRRHLFYAYHYAN
jgi:hypothetical protein